MSKKNDIYDVSAELAERIGADKGYISRIERGITVPTVATL